LKQLIQGQGFLFIDFGANRKRVCDFLLVVNSNLLGPILPHFRHYYRISAHECHQYSTWILRVFPLDQIAHVGISQGQNLS